MFLLSSSLDQPKPQDKELKRTVHFVDCLAHDSVLVGLDSVLANGSSGHFDSTLSEELIHATAMIVYEDSGGIFRESAAVAIGGTPITACQIAENARLENLGAKPMSYRKCVNATSDAPASHQILSFIVIKVRPDHVNDFIVILRSHLGLAAYTGKEFRTAAESYVIETAGITCDFALSALIGLIDSVAASLVRRYRFEPQHH